ncbi:MAG: hypothetical protein V7691_14620 [Galbibacter orientalis]|uniref:hypothetical protein n=1 Tax=Galbibacter orientalis TaxID=453852 RepID=UPI00300160E9
MILSFSQEINRFKNRLPFADLVESNNDLRAFIQKEWEEKHGAKNFHFLDLESIKRLQEIKGCIEDFEHPLKDNEDRIEIAKSLTQNIINNLRKLNNPEVANILIEEFINGTEKQLDLIKVKIWAKHSHEPIKNLDELWQDSILDYKILKGHADLLLTDYSIQNALKNPYPEIFYGNDNKSFKLFESFLKQHVVDEYSDIGFIFQRMMKDKLLQKTPHKTFMHWLKDEEFISERCYDKFIEKVGFRSLGKSPSVKRNKHYFFLRNSYFPDFKSESA